MLYLWKKIQIILFCQNEKSDLLGEFIFIFHYRAFLFSLKICFFFFCFTLICSLASSCLHFQAQLSRLLVSCRSQVTNEKKSHFLRKYTVWEECSINLCFCSLQFVSFQSKSQSLLRCRCFLVHLCCIRFEGVERTVQ